ncbi:hypothetical protein RPB_0744 [Rhodopseudomonas palustris HaA2]|uniref:Uncharacterized protein n=1 Tax=Rhodopseudomonas palustris (strain HaA2) TaxID=316058 RepID=Q2J255_RHOP2|nr:hypothetical protein [Rhodopseudomonas palustris]ABD05455.1 hypothetical protein RPB_0744 [Rhodopseudomonas palustris HaA2]
MTTTRITSISVATIAAATLFAGSALANNQAHQGSLAEPPSNGCSSYMKAPDGSWTKIPCTEAGASAAASRRNSTRTSEKSD